MESLPSRRRYCLSLFFSVFSVHLLRIVEREREREREMGVYAAGNIYIKRKWSVPSVCPQQPTLFLFFCFFFFFFFSLSWCRGRRARTSHALWLLWLDEFPLWKRLAIVGRQPPPLYIKKKMQSLYLPSAVCPGALVHNFLSFLFSSQIYLRICSTLLKKESFWAQQVYNSCFTRDGGFHKPRQMANTLQP